MLRSLYRMVVSHDLVYLQATPPLELAYSILPALLMAKFFGKQIVISFAGGNVEDLNGKISRFLTPMLRLADKIIVPTEWSARVLARHHLPVEVIPTLVESGADTVRLIQEVQPRILSFLLAGPESNLTTILRAVRLAKQKYPRLELTLVGSSEKLRSAEPVASQEGLVQLIDASNLDLVRRCWKECDLLVNNSSDDDLPTPVLRALTLGIPVVSCDAGGMTAVIQHGQSGLIFPANDPVALAGRIIDLIEQPHLVTQLSRSGPTEAYRFEWPSVRGRWISLFNRYSN
jgi:glycosyltransferase involved in cell wall biosynthesis